MRKIVTSSILAIVAVCAMLGVASASGLSTSVADEGIVSVNIQIDTISFDIASCCKQDKCGSKCGSCKPKCGGCDKPKCGGCDKPKCGGCDKPKCGGCDKPKCGGCDKPKCGGCDKPKCGCDKPKCGCEKQSCGCKSKCGCPECCPKQVENYPDANRGAEGEWARDGLSRQRA